MDGHIVTACIPSDLGADANVPLFKVPAAGQGGAVTLTGAWMHNSAATTGTPSFTARLVDMGEAGTAVEGTVSASVGGTADHWAALTPKSLALSTPVVAAGHWIGLEYVEVDGGNNAVLQVAVTLAPGRGVAGA